MSDGIRAFLLCLPIALFAQGAMAAELVLYVFQDGSPMSGTQALLDEKQPKTIPDSGRVEFALDQGDHQLQLVRNGTELHQMRFTSGANENADVIVRLPSGDDEAVDVTVETYNPGGAVAQREGVAKGRLSGRINSRETGAAISGARISPAGLQIATMTDADGRFSLSLPRGVYDLEINHPEYGGRTLDDVRIVTSINQQVGYSLSLSSDGGPIEEVVATASYVPDTATEQVRSSDSVLESISADQMAAVGDSEAVDALRRVTGLSVNDGKFISVRGQPERYTETTLNGSRLPSPDPIREIVPLDLFPTSVLSSINVSKSFDSSQPGSFGGGLVDLRTLSAPAEDYFEISVETGGNTESTFDDGLTNEGGDLDFFGTDDGTRERSDGLGGLDGNTGSSSELVQGARDMPNIWEVDSKTLPPDAQVKFAGGMNTQLFGANLGINGTLGWEREFRQTETIEQDFAGTGVDGELSAVDRRRELRTDQQVEVDGFFTASLDWVNHTLTSNTFLSRETTDRTEFITGERTVSDALEIQDFQLDFNERQMLGEQLLGEHDFDMVNVDWRFLLARAERDNPDRREYRRTRSEGSDDPFRLTDREDASRTFIDTEDDIASFGLDLDRTAFENGSVSVDVAGGASFDRQDRESSTRILGLRPDPREVDTSAPIEEILAPDNLGNGIEVKDESIATDFYDGTADINAGYLKADMGWADTVRFVAGLRAENADFEVETLKNTDNPVSTGFEETDVLPSLSATWFFAEQMQARVAVGRTVSRPTLTEIAGNPNNGAGIRFRDPDNNDKFVGNPDLDPAEIDSLDARWEWFPSRAEVVTLGFFYKDFTDALEEELIPSSTRTLRRIVNADSAEVYGFELNARLDLPTIMSFAGVDWRWADPLYLRGNAALIDSEVTDGSRKRPLQGQPDELVNMLVGYDSGGHDLALALNFTGERLATTTQRDDVPNIFEEGRTLVDIKYDYRWSDNLSLSGEIGNALNADVTETQGGRTFKTFEPGVDLEIGAKYRF